MPSLALLFCTVLVGAAALQATPSSTESVDISASGKLMRRQESEDQLEDQPEDSQEPEESEDQRQELEESEDKSEDHLEDQPEDSQEPEESDAKADDAESLTQRQEADQSDDPEDSAAPAPKSEEDSPVEEQKEEAEDHSTPKCSEKYSLLGTACEEACVTGSTALLERLHFKEGTCAKHNFTELIGPIRVAVYVSNADHMPAVESAWHSDMGENATECNIHHLVKKDYCETSCAGAHGTEGEKTAEHRGLSPGPCNAERFSKYIGTKHVRAFQHMGAK